MTVVRIPRRHFLFLRLSGPTRSSPLGRAEATNRRDSDSPWEVFLWSLCNSDRLRDGIQSESRLMILIQAATSDKAPVLCTAPGRSPMQ